MTQPLAPQSTTATPDISNFTGMELLQVIQSLTHLLNTETTYLKQMKLTDISALQEEKHRLLNVLEAAKKLAKASPSYFTQTLSADRIQQASLTLAIAMEANHYELAKAQAVNQTILQCLADAAKQFYSEQAGYTRQGTFKNFSPKKHHVEPMALRDQA